MAWLWEIGWPDYYTQLLVLALFLSATVRSIFAWALVLGLMLLVAWGFGGIATKMG